MLAHNRQQDEQWDGQGENIMPLLQAVLHIVCRGIKREARLSQIDCAMLHTAEIFSDNGAILKSGFGVIPSH